MNESAQTGLMGIMVFSALVVAGFYCVAWIAGWSKPGKPKPQPVTKQDRDLMKDLCQRLSADLTNMADMPLRPEDREVLLEHKRDYEMTMSTFNVNDGAQFDSVMLEINRHRRWVSSFKDRLLTQSVPRSSLYHDYNR